VNKKHIVDVRPPSNQIERWLQTEGKKYNGTGAACAIRANCDRTFFGHDLLAKNEAIPGFAAYAVWRLD
jgi:hypothetical protein